MSTLDSFIYFYMHDILVTDINNKVFEIVNFF